MKSVFGFLTGTPHKELLELSLEQLNELIESHRKTFLSSIENETRNIRQNMKTVLEQVREIARALSVVEVGELPDNPSIPTRVSGITIARSLGAFSKRLLGLSERFSIPPPNSFEDMISQRDEVQRLVKNIAESVLAHRKILSLRFQADLKMITRLAKKLDSQLSSLTLLIESNRDRFDKFRRVDEGINNVRMIIAEMQKIKSEIERSRNQLEGLRTEIDRLGQAIETTKSSAEYVEELDLSLKLESLRKHLSQIQTMLELQFVEIRKPLLKHRHITQLDMGRETLVERYLESPSQAIMDDESLDLRETLAELEGQIRRGLVKVKNPEKIVEKIRRVLEKLEDWRDELVSLRRRISDLETSTASPMMQQMESIRNRREHFLHEYERVNDDYSKLVKSLDEKQQQLGKKQSCLERESASIVLKPIKIRI